METLIKLTPMHTLLIATQYDETQIFIVVKKAGKEIKYFYTEMLFQDIKDWDNRELEAHLNAVSYAWKVIVNEGNIGGKLLSGKFIPERESHMYFIGV